ncbi:AlbA family DNA-binding domain-containing protein [Maribellus maritimus]|uniref:AlbA family DNA-binding domain-containing protein n=1 Tax=Maribellus maritimus TaxID=2870838 RepID=UPI001EEC81EB|nr:ATP-binding protein [Maribellus maritimus]MCG6189105.1 ATP-binding protein [Maribellus maritimus]
MDEILDLILYENENIRLDFKRDEYKKNDYVSLLKDILSMANAFTMQERFIIIGLKPKSNKNRGIKGIDGELTDAATYQQLVHENIEPELSIDYFPFYAEEKKLGIIKISNCTNPPYLMKKDYGNGEKKLFKGEGFIRKGTHQARLIRRDFDRYMQNRFDEKYFNDEIKISFVANNLKNQIELVSFDDIKRPSQIQKEKIQTILTKKKEEKERYKAMGMQDINIDSLSNSMDYMNAAFRGGGIPYRSRSIETLEENLKNVEKTYYEEDLYEVFEKNSAKCNISIFNMGHKYIEEASVILKIPKLDGLAVVDQVYSNPDNPSGFVGTLHYPEVTEEEGYFIIKDDVGNIKHQLDQELFDIPLRIFASQRIIQNSFMIHCELFAKNIKTSIKKDIEVKISTGNK